MHIYLIFFIFISENKQITQNDQIMSFYIFVYKQQHMIHFYENVFNLNYDIKMIQNHKNCQQT